MAETIDLDALPVNPNFREPIKDKEGTGIGDYGRSAAAGAYGIVGSLASGADYLLDTDEDSTLKGVRNFAEEGAKYQIGKMSDGAREALNAGFLPGGEGKSIWEPDVSIANSLGLKLANAAPSLLASILPGGIAAGAARAALTRAGVAGAQAAGAAVAAGTGTSGAINATMMGGDVFNDIEKGILDAKEADLREGSELYAKLRDDGYSDTVARKVLVEAAAGNKPLVMGAVGALAEQFGAGALAARGAAHVAEAGVRKGIKKGLAEEGVTEAGQNALQEGLTQQGNREAGTQRDFDWQKILEQTVQGGVVGGIMGGAVGGVVGQRAKGRDSNATTEAEPAIDPVVDAAARNLGPTQNQDETPASRAKAGLEEAGRQLDQTKAAIDAARAPAGQPNADVAAAINAEPVQSRAAVKDAPVTRESNSDFVPENEYEADPDFDPAAQPAAPEAPVPAQEPTEVAPTQAPEPQELPAQPETAPAAVAPSEASQTPVGETIDLDTYPTPPAEPQPDVLRVLDERDAAAAEQPAEPRVLEAVTKPKNAAGVQKRSGRVTASELKRIAAGEGDAITLSHDPADWQTKDDRATVYKIAEAFAERSKVKGEPVKPWVLDVLSARGNMQKRGAVGAAAREKYYAARQVFSDDTLSRQTEGVARRETKDEAAARELSDKRRLDATNVARILAEVPLSDRAAKGIPAAVREHAQLVLDVAKKMKVEAPVGTQDPHLLYLRNAAEVAKPGSNREAAMQFVTDDFFLRNNAGEELSARRRAQAMKSEQSYDEVERSGPEVREGTDKSEEYDAQGVSNDVSYTPSDEDVSQPEAPEARNINPTPDRVEPDRGADVSQDGPTVVAGQNRAGKFQVEARGRRRASQAPVVTRPSNPTEAQKEAGNYQMGHKRVAGLDISIETAKGATRSGTDANGRKWSVKMPADYGYVKGTKGVDGDHVDVYLGPGARMAESYPVYVVNQNNLDGTFDEHKAMIGFSSPENAMSAYTAGFSDGKGEQRMGSVVSMTMNEFKEWSKNPKGPAELPSEVGKVKYVPYQRRQQPAAREATSAQDIEAFFNQTTAQDTFDANDGVDRVVSPRTGIGVRALATQSLKSILAKVDHTQVGGVTAQTAPFFARRLRDMVGDVPVRIVSSPDMTALVSDLAGKNGFPARVAGYYEPSTHEIILDESSLTDDAAASHLLIHEGMHAAFMDLLNTSKPARTLVQDAMDAIRATNPREAENYYGMKNVHEFISEAFSSRSFQDFLSTIPAPRAYRSLTLNNVWQMFVSGVRRFLRLGTGTDTMLDASLRIGATLVDLRTARSDVPSSPRAMAPAAFGGDTQAQIKEGLGDVTQASKGGVTRAIMRVRTLDQLRQQFQGLFPDGEGGSHLDRIVRNLQRMQPFVADKRETGEKFAERFVNLQRTDPKVAQESAELRNDVTMANANLLPGNPTQEQVKAANKHLFGNDPEKSDISAAWQSKAQVFDLQRRFSKLPGAVQNAMLEEAAYYKKMQNDISGKLVQNILDQFAPDMAVGQRRELVAKTLSGTLNEEDRKAIGNNTFYNALKGAKELKSIAGMYFPLMRHGKYVVRTTDIVADTKGGREVEPGVVEFRAAKDKEARKAAEAFAKDSDLTVTRVVKKYFDPVTGEAIKAVDATSASEVAYQVKVQTEGVHFFDTRTQAERFTREARRDKSEGKPGAFHKVSDWQERENLEQRGDLTGSQLASLVNSIRSRDDIPEAQRQMMATAIGQAAVRLMSGNRIQQKSLPRRRVQGASAEYGRNALSYASSASSYLGKLEYMPRIRESMSEMRKQASDRYGADAQTKYHLFQEIQGRVDSNDVGIKQPSGFVRDLFAVTMLSKLFSPAHSLINATQPLMVSYPVLAGRHGQTASAHELTKAFRDVGALGAFRQGITNTGRAIRDWKHTGVDSEDVTGSIRRKLAKVPDGQALGRLLDDMRDRGALDDRAQFELAASVAAGRGAAGTALAKMDRIFRQAPTAVEAVNRTVTAVAAYRLGRRKGMTEENARDYAFDTVMNTQGDYSPTNAAPIFNNSILRPFLQFKKYGQMMTNLYVDMIYRTFKGATVEERRVALKQFGTLVATQTLVAGAMSIPGLELAKAGFVLAAMLGIGDGWEEQDRRIKRLANEALGESWSEMVRKGIVSRAVGIDLSSRLSLADMWTFGEPKKYKTPEITQWIAEQYFGASGGTAFSMREGVVAAQEGDLMKAAAKMVPIKAFADIAKGANSYMDESLSLPGAIVQGIGIKPSSLANKLRSRFIDARSSGELLKIRAEVIRYNRTAEPRNRLSIPSMERMREENRKERTR